MPLHPQVRYLLEEMAKSKGRHRRTLPSNKTAR